MRSTTRSGKPPNADRNWSGCLSSRYVRVASTVTHVQLGVLASCRLSLARDVQSDGHWAAAAGPAPGEPHGARAVLLLRWRAESGRPRQDPAGHPVPARVRLQLGLRLRHPDGPQGGGGARIRGERRVLAGRYRGRRAVRIRLAAQRPLSRDWRLRADRAGPLPEADPRGLAAGRSTHRRTLDVFGRGGELDEELRAAQRRLLQPDLPAHLAHDALTDGEAQSRPFVWPLGREERVEDPVPDRCRHAGARGLHREADPTLPRLCAQLDDGGVAPADRMLRVGDEVDHDLLQLLAEGEYGGRGIVEAGAGLPRLGGQHALGGLGDGLGEGGDPHAGGGGGGGAGGGPQDPARPGPPPPPPG